MVEGVFRCEFACEYSLVFSSRLFVFGSGRRSCIGEGLAHSRMFLFIAGLCQRYTFLPAEDSPLVDPDPRTFNYGIVLSSDRYKCRCYLRS